MHGICRIRIYGTGHQTKQQQNYMSIVGVFWTSCLSMRCRPTNYWAQICKTGTNPNSFSIKKNACLQKKRTSTPHPPLLTDTTCLILFQRCSVRFHHKLYARCKTMILLVLYLIYVIISIIVLFPIIIGKSWFTKSMK